MNTLGDSFTFTGFGESHGPAVGGVLDGVPAGVPIDLDAIREALDRRAGRQGHKGLTAGVSPRAVNESDQVEWLSGVMDGVSLGTPIAFLIRNTNTHPEDYARFKDSFRSGHADYTYARKYGLRDYRGGGRASARETAGRVVAGTIAAQLLRLRGITIHAELCQVGVETDPARWSELLQQVRQANDSVGGIVTCSVMGLPVGLGEPVFDKLQSHLSYAMLSINGCKGFEYGTGFDMRPRGSELYKEVPCPASGGIEGGISNGLELTFRCAFKPAASVQIGGRHDACIAVRAVPVVEAMTALVIQNFIQQFNKNKKQ